MLNQAIIMGRITKDLELRITQTGTYVLSFTVAVERDYSGEQEKVTDFIPVIAFNKTAQFIANYFGKGRMICINGRIQVRSYNAQDGSKRYATEIIADRAYFTGEKKDDAQAPAGYQGGYQAPTANNSNAQAYDCFEMIDDVPF